MTRARNLAQLITGPSNTTIPMPAVRQTVYSASVNQATGQPNFLASGVANAVTMLASSTNAGITFANGTQDFNTVLGQDVVNAWNGLSPNNLNFLSQDYVTASSVNYTSSTVPPQYGMAYNTASQSILQFGGAAGSTTFIDDFGNTWTAQGGAKVQTNQVKFGTGALGGGGANNALNGSTDYIKTTNITTFGSGGWSIRAWVNPSALPASGGLVAFAEAHGPGGAGFILGINNTSGAVRFVYYLSSNGANWDIASAATGSTAPVVGTWYYIELTFDQVAGVYRLYVNGVMESSSTTSSKVSGGFTVMGVGASTAANYYFSGYLDKFEFLPYCQHPAGTTYAVPTAAPNIAAPGYASDFYNINQGIMYSVTGPGPTLTPIKRVYVGEATTNAPSALLHFDGANGSTTFNDDYGNGWVAGGGSPKISTANSKFGGAALLLNGSADYLRTAVINSVAPTWTVEFWFYTNSAGTQQRIITLGNNSSQVGFAVSIISSKMNYYLAGTPSSWSIVNGGVGSTTFASSTWYHFAMTFDGSTYRGFVNGVLDYSLSSTTPISSNFGGVILGLAQDGTLYFNGYIDEFRLSQQARYTTNFTVPAVPFVVDETKVSSLIPYALNGRYVSPDTPFAALGTVTTFQTNLGVQYGVTARADAIVQNSDSGWTPGQIIYNIQPGTNPGTYASATTGIGIDSRNTCSYTTGSTYQFMGVNKTSGNTATYSAGTANITNFKLRVTAQRSF